MRRRRALAFAAILGLCVGCDHATKQLATSALAGAETISFASDTVRFELARNPGAFLGVGAPLPSAVRALLFGVLVPLGLAVACVLAVRTEHPAARTLHGLALVAGGGLGNWADRVLHGGTVTDFVSLGAGPLRTGVFNLADVCIVAGFALLLLPPGRRPGPT